MAYAGDDRLYPELAADLDQVASHPLDYKGLPIGELRAGFRKFRTPPPEMMESVDRVTDLKIEGSLPIRIFRPKGGEFACRPLLFWRRMGCGRDR